MTGKLTDAQVRALRILRRFPDGMRPREFGRLMWPDAAGWAHHTNCGPKGVTRGGGMNLAAGGFLGKLRKAGFASYLGWLDGYVLSREGQRVLDEYERDNPTDKEGGSHA